VRTRGTSSGFWIALAAAWLLLVQSIAGSFAAAPQQALDAFGNPLCITSTDHSQPDNDHHKVPGCCILGCNAIASYIASPPDDAWLENGFEATTIRFAPALRDIVVGEDDHDPGSPRAPPTLV
jgi:hypothetical protein